ncbi:MAG TPA: hypothetical protein VEY12_06090, partial [Thermoplasmata archaeon]|nr:hypothetical protein [Thermoplasmata archaeon]
MPTLLPYQQFWPLATVGVWWGLAVYQVYRDRYRTWTEAFFLAACLFAGAYALADVFFFTVPTQDEAMLAALLSFSVLTLAVVFIFLFALVFYTRMRQIYLVTLLPAVGLISMVWLFLVNSQGIASFGGNNQPPWIGNWNRTVFAIWAAGALVYAVLGAYFLLRTYREVAHETRKLRRRMFGLLVSALLAVVLGTVTNTFRGVTGNPDYLPLFSTGLVFPGIVSVITLSPRSPERFSVAVRRWKASRYDIKAAFIIYTDGTLIGAKVRPGEKVIDQDLFSATLDVIQNFMRTSFPTLRGSLSAIKHGDYTLVMERGKHAYLTVILKGEEND